MKQTIITTTLALSLIAGTALAHSVNSPAAGDQAQWRYGMMGMHGGGMMGTYGGVGMYGQCRTNQVEHGPGMMNGFQSMMDPGFVEQRDTFLKTTVDLRKKIHDKMYEYAEATRNPDETVGSLREKEKEIYSLRQELVSKRQKIFTDK